MLDQIPEKIKKLKGLSTSVAWLRVWQECGAQAVAQLLTDRNGLGTGTPEAVAPSPCLYPPSINVIMGPSTCQSMGRFRALRVSTVSSQTGMDTCFGNALVFLNPAQPAVCLTRPKRRRRL